MYPRKIQKEIQKWLNREEILILNGPRQVGKTFLLKLVKEDLLRQGIDEKCIFILNLEDLEHLNTLNKSPKNIWNYIVDSAEKNYFLIDEIQYLDSPSNFLKYVYDEYRDKIKIIATGSSSLELKAKFQDSLAGRKIVFQVYPLSFAEFLDFKQSDLVGYLAKSDVSLDKQNLFRKYLDEYLLYGGLPKVVLADDVGVKKRLLAGYVSDYINKDVRYFGKIDNILAFNQLTAVLAGQIGGLLNIQNTANAVGLKRAECVKFLNLLEQTFVLHRLPPYFKNIRSQIVKMRKIYYFDIGIRNQLIANFSPIEFRNDNGALFDNFIYLELKNHLDLENLYFYRTNNKTEIDFIFEKDDIIYPIEAKYTWFNKPENNRVLQNFCQARAKNCKRAYLANLNFACDNDPVFVPFWRIDEIVGSKK